MKKLKDIYTEKEFNKLSQEDRETGPNDYEGVTTKKKNLFIRDYIKKELYYGNPKDIIKDNMCDLSFLEGAIVKKVGFHKKAREGGLAIVYSKNGQEQIVVIGFTEMGAWIYANVPKN